MRTGLIYYSFATHLSVFAFPIMESSVNTHTFAVYLHAKANFVGANSDF